MNDENLIPAKKGEVRNPNGRPRGSKTNPLRKYTKGLRKKLKLDEYSPEDLMEVVPVLQNMSYDEITKEAKDNETPSGFSGLARLWLNDKYRLQLLAWYYDRKYGKAQQHIEQNTSISVEKQLTPKEAAELMRKLDEEV